MTSVRSGPSSGRPFLEEAIAGRASLTGNGPRRDIVREVTGVAFVIEGELLDGAVSRMQRLEFVLEIPLPAAPGTRNHWGDVLRLVIVHT